MPCLYFSRESDNRKEAFFSDMPGTKAESDGVPRISCSDDTNKSSAADYEGKDSSSYSLMSNYGKLPDCLRSCFEYCCYYIRYPEQKDKLVRVLLAEGLISEKPGEILEDSAEKMIEELIDLGLLQPSNLDGGVEINLKIPDSCHELFLHQVKEQDFIARAANSPVRVVIEDDGKNIPPNFGSLRIQSLFLITADRRDHAYFHTPGLSGSYLDTICSLQNLVMLEIQGKVMYLPNEVGDLVHLKYLRLFCSDLNKLPGSIGNLQKLQTLDISMRGNKLPEEVLCIKHLRHLLMSRTISPFAIIVPNRIGTWVNLHTLTGVCAGNGIANELGTLMQLRNISVNQVSEDHAGELSAAIMKMENLICLSLEANSPFLKNEFYGLLPEFEQFSPPPLLQNVSLCGILVELPSWLASVNNLTNLRLSFSNLMDYSFLQNIPRLKHLTLWNASKATMMGNEFCKAGGFPKLETLMIASLTLIEWTEIVEGAFPSLRNLCFRNCVNLKFLPEGLRNIPTLEELTLIPAYNDIIRRLEGEEYYKIMSISKVLFYEN